MTAPGARIGLELQIACVRRELGLRARVYPGLVNRGKMRASEAGHETAAMEAVLKTLQFVQRHRAAIARLAESGNPAGEGGGHA